MIVFNDFDILHTIHIIEDINDWKQSNRKPENIARLGRYLTHVIERSKRLNNLRGY